jgi:uncharacterized membrane protein YphA (DoxX/SURF4 family)
MRRNTITDIIAASFVFLFVYAAFSKVVEYHKFKVQLGQSPLLTGFADSVAWLIPLIEIVTAISLVTERFRYIGLFASFGLMSMFSAYIIAITKFSDYIPCSCGGILQKMTWNQHLVFNIFFTMLAALAIINYKQHLPKPLFTKIFH